MSLKFVYAICVWKLYLFIFLLYLLLFYVSVKLNMEAYILKFQVSFSLWDIYNSSEFVMIIYYK